ncbi:MAG: GNAT family N-acetyltransferase [bacterium]|nr:GNAT family N-acetyltransferase [bacterium]
MTPAIRRATLDEILALRHVELRPGLPLATARFDGDDAPDTWHLGAFEDAAAVACASFMRQAWEGAGAYQLRGMATRADRRRRGLGAALLRFAEATIPPATGVHVLWCNARVAAIDFYRRCGWTVESEVFDVPTVGPHRRMRRALPPPVGC